MSIITINIPRSWSSSSKFVHFRLEKLIEKEEDRIGRRASYEAWDHALEKAFGSFESVYFLRHVQNAFVLRVLNLALAFLDAIAVHELVLLDSRPDRGQRVEDDRGAELAENPVDRWLEEGASGLGEVLTAAN